jgi:Fe-S-cluster-containing hydrogenase component 2
MMDKKILTVDPEKCTGCRNCELVCSVRHNGVSNPSLARIQIVKWEDIGVYIPMSCQQCEDAPCMAVCPKDAIYRDEDLERIRINHELCIGCKMCVAACPFGAAKWDSKRSAMRALLLHQGSRLFENRKVEHRSHAAGCWKLCQSNT